MNDYVYLFTVFIAMGAVTAAVAGAGIQLKTIDALHRRSRPHPLQESGNQPGSGTRFVGRAVEQQHPLSRRGCVLHSNHRQGDHHSFGRYGADKARNW